MSKNIAPSILTFARKIEYQMLEIIVGDSITHLGFPKSSPSDRLKLVRRCAKSMQVLNLGVKGAINIISLFGGKIAGDSVVYPNLRSLQTTFQTKVCKTCSVLYSQKKFFPEPLRLGFKGQISFQRRCFV